MVQKKEVHLVSSMVEEMVHYLVIDLDSYSVQWKEPLMVHHLATMTEHVKARCSERRRDYCSAKPMVRPTARRWAIKMERPREL